MVSNKFKVVDRKGATLCEFEENAKSDSLTIRDLMKTIIKKSDKLCKQICNFSEFFINHIAKKQFDINRMRLTLNDAKGKALSDKRQILSKFFTETDL